MKQNLVYILTIQVNDGDAVVIENPFTISFRVERSTLATANKGYFTIYNLNEATRSKLFKDINDTLKDKNQDIHFRRLTLEAGYSSNSKLPIIFRGNILQAYSYKNGPDWTTEIECFDGGDGILNGRISETFPKDVALREIIISCIKAMPNVEVGAVGNFTDDRSRGLTVCGTCWDEINRLVGDGDAFIDNEKVYALQKNEYVERPDGVLEISSETGLIGSPRRSAGRMDVTMIFEPYLRVRDKVSVVALETVNDGFFVVAGVSHRGTISESVSSKVVTTANFLTVANLVGVSPQ